MTRRHFIAAAVAAPLAGAGSGKPSICIFSKHMAQFGYDDLGRNAKQIGFEGVDLTVRDKGHVLPGKAAEDMPRAVEAIRSHNVSVPMITTNILSASDPTAASILSTASRLKIPFWKLGYHKYQFDEIEQTIAKVREATAGLTALSKQHGIVAGFHNHSGDHYGAAVWDIRTVIQELDPKWVGYYYDPAHASIEGGLAGWRISQNLVAPRMKMVALKDFYWLKNKEGQWKVNWCPMGEGMVEWNKVFAGFAAARFTGPLSVHVEYHTSDELAAIAKDFAFIKKQVSAAYGS